MDASFSEIRTPPILIVDDDAEFAAVLREGIIDAGFRPICACDGREALSAITHEKPAMVLIDIEMPELNGVELIRRMERSPALAQIPRAILTGSNNPALHSSITSPILRKPIQLQQLLALIRRVVWRS
jgi:CheY-like chemotaxis protein